jgi:uncharacterized membrane protein
MSRFAAIGRVCLGAALAGSGLMQLVNRDFVRLVPKLPAWVPAPGVWPIVTGALLLAIGLAFVTNRKVGAAANLLAVMLLASFVVQRIPEIVANPGTGFIWTNPAKVLALAGGALLLAAGARVGTLAAGALGIFLLICGAQHFVYAGFVDTLVPAWVPPNPRFWTILTAVALLVGGAGVIWPRTRRLAGLLVGVMIFLWVPLVHGARTVELKTAFELAGVFEALALGGVAWLAAAAPLKLGVKG